MAGKTPRSDPPIQPRVPVQRSKAAAGHGWQRRLLERGRSGADSGSGKSGEGEMKSSEEAPCSGQVSGETEHPGDRRRMQREPLDGKGEEVVES